MDLRIYYQKLRQAEARISGPYVVMVSSETPDGGRAGRMTEVSRAVAAKMLVEGRALLANEEETAQFRAETSEAQRAAEESAASAKLQIRVVSDSEMKTLKSALRTKA